MTPLLRFSGAFVLFASGCLLIHFDACTTAIIPIVGALVVAAY